MADEGAREWARHCPVPIGRYEHVVLGHGSGGRLSHELLHKLFLPAFANPALSALGDASIVEFGVDVASLANGASGGSGGSGGPGRSGGTLAMTTDSFVVQPLFFPGGDIGTLAVCGTVNDLAVAGAEPKVITAAFILEEGLPFSDLTRIVRSMKRACDEAGVVVIAGDTKVVERGKGDGCFITTTGLGVVPAGRDWKLQNANVGDRVVVSGSVGDHGVAVLSVREGLAFETTLVSDCASLVPLCRLLADVPGVRGVRDATRGGVTSVLHELKDASGHGVVVDEAAVVVNDDVRGACEMLGLDPLYVANEGKLIVVVAAAECERALTLLRSHPLGKDAAVIGTVVADPVVTVRSAIGGERLLSLLSGEQLPRIC